MNKKNHAGSAEPDHKTSMGELKQCDKELFSLASIAIFLSILFLVPAYMGIRAYDKLQFCVENHTGHITEETFIKLLQVVHTFCYTGIPIFSLIFIFFAIQVILNFRKRKKIYRELFLESGNNSIDHYKS